MSYGIIEYDYRGNPKCELCGRHYVRVLLHARFKHNIHERDYKKQFGLDLNKGICSKESSLKTREKTIANFDKCTAKAIEHCKKFKKGHPGRTKDMVSEQTRIRLYNRWITLVSREQRIINGQKVGALKLGYPALLEKRRLHKKRENYGKALIQPAILKYLAAWCLTLTNRNKDDADDLMQETLLTAWLIQDKYESHMQTWLCSIAKNKWLQHCKKVRHSKLDYVEDVSDIAIEQADEYDEPEDFPYTLDDLRRVFKVLSPNRQIFMYLMMQNMKYSDIADLVGNTEANVKSTIYQAREQIKRILSCPNVTAAINSLPIVNVEFQGHIINM